MKRSAIVPVLVALLLAACGSPSAAASPARAVVRSCSSCALSKMPRLSAFLRHGASGGRFSNVEVEWVPGAEPTVSFFDARGEPTGETDVALPDEGEEGVLRLLAERHGFVALRAPPPAADTEPDGVLTTEGGVRLEYFSGRASLEGAMAVARARGGALLRPRSEEERSGVRELVAKRHRHGERSIWVSAREVGDGTWVGGDGVVLYSDGKAADGELVGFAGGRPFKRADTFRCLYTDASSGNWFAAPCESFFAYVVARRPPPQQQQRRSEL